MTDQKASQTIALEVELTQKAESSYRSVTLCYEEWHAVYQVLWVVSRSSIAKKIDECAKQFRSSSSKNNFVYLKDVYLSGWQAVIFNGALAGKTIRDALAISAQNGHENIFTHFALDTRKSHAKSSSCRLLPLPGKLIDS